MKLVAGLGNPGDRYHGTRHNVGFAVLDCLAERHGLASAGRVVGEGVETKWRRPAGDVLLVRPLTFMNLSGRAIAERAQFYKVALPDILVVSDDVNLPLGRLRTRGSGSEGGHNGLRSVSEAFGTESYARLRVGVGRGDRRWDLADHVLARFEPEERPVIDEAVERAADAVETWIDVGLVAMMNAFNRPDDGS